ncbi:hypothetical protein BKA70DRAFT_1444634 [Coprinopsis sp. MPI-PUGE-AT-0042]|nr:hypothetical protein BKA70DRAFT_1444634 [Coprinopsis sp. MPI-PUGE-AT-0042]
MASRYSQDEINRMPLVALKAIVERNLSEGKTWPPRVKAYKSAQLSHLRQVLNNKTLGWPHRWDQPGQSTHVGRRGSISSISSVSRSTMNDEVVQQGDEASDTAGATLTPRKALEVDAEYLRVEDQTMQQEKIGMKDLMQQDDVEQENRQMQQGAGGMEDLLVQRDSAGIEGPQVQEEGGGLEKLQPQRDGTAMEDILGQQDDVEQENRQERQEEGGVQDLEMQQDDVEQENRQERQEEGGKQDLEMQRYDAAPEDLVQQGSAGIEDPQVQQDDTAMEDLLDQQNDVERDNRQVQREAGVMVDLKMQQFDVAMDDLLGQKDSTGKEDPQAQQEDVAMEDRPVRQDEVEQENQPPQHDDIEQEDRVRQDGARIEPAHNSDGTLEDDWRHNLVTLGEKRFGRMSDTLLALASAAKSQVVHEHQQGHGEARQSLGEGQRERAPEKKFVTDSEDDEGEMAELADEVDLTAENNFDAFEYNSRHSDGGDSQMSWFGPENVELEGFATKEGIDGIDDMDGDEIEIDSEQPGNSAAEENPPKLQEENATEELDAMGMAWIDFIHNNGWDSDWETLKTFKNRPGLYTPSQQHSCWRTAVAIYDKAVEVKELTWNGKTFKLHYKDVAKLVGWSPGWISGARQNVKFLDNHGPESSTPDPAIVKTMKRKTGLLKFYQEIDAKRKLLPVLPAPPKSQPRSRRRK